MAAKVKHLLNRDGRYFARIVIPKELRAYLGNKTELREPLGADRRAAIAAHYGAMARLQAQIAIAERKMQIATGAPAEPGRYPLPVDQIALRNYNERLALDAEFRNDHRYAAIGFDDRIVSLLRDGIAGKLPDDALEALVGKRIERFRRLGNTAVAFGSAEWRTLARAMAIDVSAPLGVFYPQPGDSDASGGNHSFQHALSPVYGRFAKPRS